VRKSSRTARPNKALIEAEANEERQRLKGANVDVDAGQPFGILWMKTHRLARNSTFYAATDTMW